MMFFRQKRFLFFSLTIFLAVLLLAKFISPLALRAATTPAGALNVPPAVAGVGAGGGGASCHLDNVFDYVAPKCGDSHASCPSIQGSYIPSSGQTHIGDLANHIQWLNDTTFIQFSGNSQFIYNIAGGTVRLAEDNIWGGQYCSTGEKAMYRLISTDGSIGSPQRRQSMSCGDTVPSDHKLQPYVFDPGINNTQDPLNYSLKTCTIAGYEGNLHTEDQLIYGGKAKCNPDVNTSLGSIDVAVFKNTVGPGEGEVYVYCKNFGLCALYENLDSSSTNQPANWDENTDVCNLKSSGQKKNDYYEFNIQRESTQSVVNNFADEYSVACLPKEEYNVGFENTEKCEQPGVYCPADWRSWNIPGKLKLTADGKTYGLFRNEETAKARVISNSSPSRTESVESYLSTPNQSVTASLDDTKTAGPANSPLNQAPIYSLTSYAQQCTFVVNKLKAVHNLCLPQNRVDLYSTAGVVSPQQSDVACGLNTNIPGTSTPYDQESMLTAFQSKNISCDDLANSDKPEDVQFLKDLLKVNVSMDTAYRPAFIVAVTTFDDPNAAENITTHAQDDGGTEPAVSGKFQVVDYLEVRVPAIATDFLPIEAQPASSQINPDRNSYQDPIRLTSDVLVNTDYQDLLKQQEIDDRTKLRQFASGNQIFGSIIGNGGAMPVFCNVNGKLIPNCAIPSGGTGPDYQDQIPQALIKFINASANVDTHQTWDALPCNSDEVAIYGPANKEHIAEQAQTIIAQLKSEKAGPYDKRTAVSTNITAKVKDVKQGGVIDTNTSLYFVTPQRYQLQYAQTSFLSFISQEQERLPSTQVNDLVSDLIDPSKFSPLLKSELNKSLTGQVKKGAYEILGTTTSTVNTPSLTTGGTGGKTVSVPNVHPFDLVGLLTDTTEKPDTHSVFWRLAGQVASLPTRMMALVTTLPGSVINEYTKNCTGNYATENWFTGKCNAAATVDPASASDGTPGTVTNMCIETKIADQATLQKYGDQLKGYLSQATTKGFWTRYYSGYLPGATVYLFEVNNPLCNPTGPCYTKVIDDAIANHINPYLAIAISLNETGGLRSNRGDGMGPHFGCGVDPNPKDGQLISYKPILKGLSCMIGAFNDYESKGLDADAALKRYGYVGGVKNPNLTKNIGIISNHTYAGVCQQPTQ